MLTMNLYNTLITSYLKLILFLSDEYSNIGVIFEQRKSKSFYILK